MYSSPLVNFKHYGTVSYPTDSPLDINVQSLINHNHAQEYYSSGTEASMYAVTPGHIASFGVVMLTAGCGYLS